MAFHLGGGKNFGSAYFVGRSDNPEVCRRQVYCAVIRHTVHIYTKTQPREKLRLLNIF